MRVLNSLARSTLQPADRNTPLNFSSCPVHGQRRFVKTAWQTPHCSARLDGRWSLRTKPQREVASTLPLSTDKELTETFKCTIQEVTHNTV